MLLDLQGIEKHFGGITALENGDLQIEAGEIHALVGENGAGKSTLMKIVAGMLWRDGGAMHWQGRPVDFTHPAEAHQAGISMVHQESLLAPHLSVAENIFLGRETTKGPLLDQLRMEAEARLLINEHGFPLDPVSSVYELSPAQKQLVEICRALHSASRLLIFDEPTSSLSDAEAAEVFHIAQDLKDRGMGIIYITHRLAELRAIADRITILRDGRTVHSGPIAALSTDQIVHHMVGREISAIYERERLTAGAERLHVDLPGIRFTLRAGEVVGIAGLMGAGRTEICQTIFGITPATHGSIVVDGSRVSINSPQDAVRAGIALITEDRQQTGLTLSMPIRTNVTLAHLDGVTRNGFVSRGDEQAVAERFRERLRIRAASVEQHAGSLSGGNQQKVVIAKWLFSDAKVLLFDEPTRGIDVAAKAEVFGLMDQLARDGAAILMVSSELPELLQIADRILVMRDGAVVTELPHSTTQQEIMLHAAVGA